MITSMPGVTNHPIRVYISSTALDLKEFRKAVIDAIRKSGDRRYTVVCMEDYTSEDAFPPEKCRQDVAGCDVYVGLFGFRYGYIPPDFEVSVTEMEYREAVATDKQILIFLASEDDPSIPVRLIDPDRSRISALRQELATRYLIHEHFKTPDDAAKQVVTALSRIPWPSLPPQDERSAADGAPDRWLRPYLEWVVATHETLELPGIRGATRLPVKLEQVYVALRGDRAGAYELAHSRDLLEDDLAEINQLYRELPDAERRQLRARWLRHAPYMLSLLERDRPGRTPEKSANPAVTMTLAEAFRNERWLVVLGDPGSGKTTLGRWLAVKLARALLADKDEGRVRVPAFQVNPETPYDRRWLDLGPARLPILVRVAKFAQALARASAADETLLLADWLSQVSWNERPPSAGERIPETGLARLFRHYLDAGRAVILLDGLDEITEAIDRADVVRAIEQFVRDRIPATDRVSGGSERPTSGGPSTLGPPHLVGGNQLVVTSRIAGYHAAPLTAAAMTHVTIEPMQQPAVEHFCDTWMQAVHSILYPRLAPEEREAQARAGATGLKQAIFDPSRPGIEEIASNPLLVTLLASLFLKRGANLPGSRVELYQTAIEMLIEDWRDAGLTLEEAFFVLDPLAAYIHERYPTGLVEETELRQVVTEYLALYRDLPVDNPPPKLAEDVRAFIRKLRDQVGLIAARGEELYGFLHLTFQEYLAGRHLARNPLTAAAAMADRLSDPRWREPILLALGYAVWKWTPERRRDLLNKLLAADDPLGVFLPRAPLFVVDALTEMKGVPEESYRLLVQRLLEAYADRVTLDRFPALRLRIEEAFQKVRRFGDREVMDELLAEAIRTPGSQDTAPAAAALVREHHWFTPILVEALVEGLDNDSPTWGWAIEQSLRDLVSPEFHAIVPPEPQPLDLEVRKVVEQLRRLESGELLAEIEARLGELPASGDLEVQLEEARKTNDDEAVKSVVQGKEARLTLEEQREDLTSGGEKTREELLHSLDAAQAQLQSFQRENAREYERALIRSRAAVAGRRRSELRQAQSARSPLPAGDLRLRSALERDPELFRRLVTDIRRLALVTAIYGGYPNCRAEQIDREYYELSALLQKPDIELNRTIDAAPALYAGRFGDDDTVYRIAVYLSENTGARLSLARTAIAFSPVALYRNSALDSLVLTALHSNSERDTLVQSLREAWQTQLTLRGRADALLGRIALGEEVITDLEAALAEPARRTAAEFALAHLARALDFLSDAVRRAGRVLVQELAKLDERDSAVWIDIVDIVLRELVLSARLPVPCENLREKAPPDYQSVLEADLWYRQLNLADDRTYNTAVLIETLPAAGPLIQGLTAAYRSPNRRGPLNYPWEIDPLPLRFVDDPAEIPIEALAALSTLRAMDLRPDLDLALFTKAFSILETRIEANPLQCAELAAFALSLGCYSSAVRLLPQLDASRDPFETVVGVARGIDDPYHRVRGLAAAMPFFSGPTRSELFEDALRSAIKVHDPFRQTRVLELLVPLAIEAERAEVLAKSLIVAGQITDPDHRSRLLVRLSRWVTSRQRAEIWAEALEAVKSIPDEDQRAETLQLLGPFVPDDLVSERLWQRAVDFLSTEGLRARASGRLGSLFLREPPASLSTLIERNPEAWAPVLLAAALRDTLGAFRIERTVRGAWVALWDRPTSQTALAELMARGEENGLPLTWEATQAINALLAAGERETLALLLPLLQTPTPEALPWVERWAGLLDDLIAHHAGLYLAEDGRRINELTIPALVALLKAGSDRSRCRAELVLRSRVFSAEGDLPSMTLTRLGAHNLEAMARLQLAAADLDVRARPLEWLTGSTLFDAPEALRRWIVQADQPGEEGRCAELILRNLLALSEDSWSAFIEGLESGGSRAHRALLQSLCSLCILQNRFPESWVRPVLEALRRLDPENFRDLKVLPDIASYGLGRRKSTGPEGFAPAHSAAVVAKCVVAAWKLQPTDRSAAAAIAERELGKAAISFADILRENSESRLLAWLSSIGFNFFTWLDGSDPEVVEAAAVFNEHPEAFAVLTQWLTQTLDSGEEESRWFPKAEALLRLTAEVARRMPAAFVQLADPRRLELLLVRTVERHSGRYGRRAAVVLLGHLRQVSQRVLKALLFALGDDREVQEAALQSADRYQEFRPDVLVPLLQALLDGNAVVAFGASRLLSAIARQERIPPAQRNDILSTLAAALQDRRSLRGVYRFSGSGQDDGDEAVRIGRFERLDRAFYRSILEITGVVGE